MSITVYNDVILPASVMLAGVRGKNKRSNTRAVMQNGEASINVGWTLTLREYELGFVPMVLSAWQAIEGLHEVTDGGAYGFLMLDPKDQTAATGEGLLYPYTTTLIGTIGLGYGVPSYKLYKRYTSLGSTRTKDRPITRPKTSFVSLTRGGSPVTIGASPGNASVNYDTGTVTFVANASQSITSITVGATTVLTFANSTGMVAAMSVGQRVYLSGITGTAATTLNSLSHAITAINTGAFTITISTVTTGLTATGGTAYKYPQASEALAWTGSFYVPVHFADDSIDWDMVRSGGYDTRLLSGPSVMLLEIRE
jgi:uncharacterized protein (TIGR02217 family)